MLRRLYRLKHDVTATAIDDDEYARFDERYNAAGGGRVFDCRG